ncbi:transcription elongation factor B polypeptide 3 [Athalia rosae]|uniref:transcription elongation factor B polypeptide 3 n=1 Tax=Athalia rosae TaxID=37344 RepID=UPI0020349561|nr:transcription elongation factor B polypeptide 3 [Athalia rosae]
MSVVEIIQHYQRSIEKCSGNEERMLYCIGKLYRLPVTVQHLQETGVGRTVNALRKYVGDVGDAAKALVAKWKTMVADEESSDGEAASDDEANISEPPDDYGSHSRHRKNEKDSSDDRDDRKELRPGNQESRSTNEIKANKSETAKSSLKNGSSDKSKSKDSHKSHSSSGSEKHRQSKIEIDKPVSTEESKNDREKRELKYDSKPEKKSKIDKDSRDHKRDSKRDEKSKSKDKDKMRVTDDLKKESAKVSCSKSLGEKKNEDNDRKRKLDSGYEKEYSKKRKHLESDGEDGNEHLSAMSDNDHKKMMKLSDDSESEGDISNIKIKIEPPSPPPKIKLEVEDIRSESKSTKEKLKGSHSSSKSKSSSGYDKTQRDEGKEMRRSDKLEEKIEHRKSEKRKDDGHHSSKESSKSKSNSSVSSSKDKVRDKDKEKDKEKDKHKEKKDHQTDNDSKETKVSSSSRGSKEKKKVKKEINGDEGIDCNSGASFAEALGMCAFPSSASRKRNNSPISSPVKKVKIEPGTTSSTPRSKSPVRVTNDVSSSGENSPPSLLSPNVKLEPLSVDLASTLPEISPNYKPLPYVNPVHRKQEEDMALSNVIYTKNQRTKVYSGNKSGYANVPTLYDICIRILIENIEALEFTGGIPYDIIKPVLERATPDQLFSLEHHNPYLIEDTDTLWQYHCNREFRTKKRQEMESWRETYMRCLDEREAKLKTLTANIKQSRDKSLPARQTKLAYVDNVVKPPRNVLRKQAKYGTARDTTTSTSDLKNKLISGISAPTNISVPPPPMARSRVSSSGVVKKTKAPLMAKALQLIKGRYKR